MPISEVMLRLRSLFSKKEIPEYNYVQAEEGNTLVETAAVADPEYKDRCVLVGVLRNARQFEIMMREKFYHIPISQVNECQFPVKYIAVYQSKRFFGKDSGVRYYGIVESCTTLRRDKIKEIPKKSKEKYLYFKIKKWQTLDSVIEAKEMELTAFSTTAYLLTSCSDTSELQLRSREEHVLYDQLVGTVKKLVRDRLPDGNGFIYKDFFIRLNGGMLYLYFGEVLEYALGYDVFLENPTDVIRDIFDYYPEV